jgi:hypothetical protein
VRLGDRFCFFRWNTGVVTIQDDLPLRWDEVIFRPRSAILFEDIGKYKYGWDAQPF